MLNNLPRVTDNKQSSQVSNPDRMAPEFITLSIPGSSLFLHPLHQIIKSLRYTKDRDLVMFTAASPESST